MFIWAGSFLWILGLGDRTYMQGVAAQIWSVKLKYVNEVYKNIKEVLDEKYVCVKKMNVQRKSLEVERSRKVDSF